MYGAGNIGRGFIGQLLSQSGYEVVFIDVNQDIIDRLNKDRSYTVELVSEECNSEVYVENVRGISGHDTQSVINEISSADLMATAVGANILPRIAGNIAEGLRERWKKSDADPLDIIICENLMDADHYLKELIGSYLNSDERDLLDKKVGLVEASIGRMVPVSTTEMQKGNILNIRVEPYDRLPVDKLGFKGTIPNIGGMIPFSPFQYFIHRKLYIHNLGHAITAYLGSKYGYTYIWEAIGDERVKNVVFGAMSEAAQAIALEHNISLIELNEHVKDLIYRFGNKQLNDTILRVGKDLLRKLSPKDRLVGALMLCKKHSILPKNIEAGIAAAINFDEETFHELETYINENRKELILQFICGLEPKSDEYGDIIELVNK